MGVGIAGSADVGMSHCFRDIPHGSSGIICDGYKGVAEIMKSNRLKSILNKMLVKRFGKIIGIKFLLGKVLKVSEVVAHGKLTNISDNLVTIQSKGTNLIISASALHENEGKEGLIFVEKVD